MILNSFPTVWFEELDEQISGVVPPVDFPYLIDGNQNPYVDGSEIPYISP